MNNCLFQFEQCVAVHSAQGCVRSLPRRHQRHSVRTAAPAAPSASSPAPGSAGSEWPPHFAGLDALGQSQTCKNRQPFRQRRLELQHNLKN